MALKDPKEEVVLFVEIPHYVRDDIRRLAGVWCGKQWRFDLIFLQDRNYFSQRPCFPHHLWKKLICYSERSEESPNYIIAILKNNFVNTDIAKSDFSLKIKMFNYLFVFLHIKIINVFFSYLFVFLVVFLNNPLYLW